MMTPGELKVVQDTVVMVSYWSWLLGLVCGVWLWHFVREVAWFLTYRVWPRLRRHWKQRRKLMQVAQ